MYEKKQMSLSVPPVKQRRKRTSQTMCNDVVPIIITTNIKRLARFLDNISKRTFLNVVRFENLFRRSNVRINL